MVAEVSLETYVSSTTKIITAFCDEYGEPISQWLGGKLFEMRCSLPRASHFDPPVELEDIADALYWDFLGGCDLENLQLLENLEANMDEILLRLENRLKELADKASEVTWNLQKRKRQADCTIAEKQEILEKIQRIETKLSLYETWVMEQIQVAREGAYQIEQDILDSLTLEGMIEPLYVIHWRIRGKRKAMEIKFPLQLEERSNAGIDAGSEVARLADIAMRQAQHKIRDEVAVKEKITEPRRIVSKLHKQSPYKTYSVDLDHDLANALSMALLGITGS